MASVSMFTWLLHSALASSVILLGGALAVARCRQPADRVRVIQWSLGATFLSLLLVGLPGFPAMTLGVLDATVETTPLMPATPPADSQAMAAASSSEPSIVDISTTPAAAFAAEKLAQSSAGDDSQPATGARAEIPRAPVRFEIVAVRIVCAAYMAGVAVFLLRWATAATHLKRLRRRARPVPAVVHEELQRIAGAEAWRATLLASDQVAAPIVWGVRRPVIVLPGSVLDEPDQTKLRFYLAHEWSHVARRDVATWQLATLLQFVLYYQPLFWWLRRRLAISMDQLADAVAADQGPSAADYAAFLLELARRHLAPAPRLSLSISDKRSRLYQRIVFLVEAAAPLSLFCSRRRNILIGAMTIALAGMASAVRLDARGAAETPAAAAESKTNESTPAAPQQNDPPVAAKSDDDKKTESITYTGRVTDRITGKPIEGVKVSVIRKLSRDPVTGTWRVHPTPSSYVV